ncbi:MAG: hypothetical protein ACYDEX_15320 [Mobilitalea sp.]
MDKMKELAALLKGFSKKKILFSGIAVVLVIALLVGIVPRLGKNNDTVTVETSDIDYNYSVLTFSEEDYNVKSKTLTISGEKPKASAYGAKIDFGEYGIESKAKLEIKELPEKKDDTTGLKVTAYDFNLEEKTDFDDIITITLPYDSKYVKKGAEGECVGAKYYNESTGEWEGVYYELDVKNKQVLIYTTHLSTYGVFQIKNENTRNAYITDVYAICQLLDTNKSYQVLEELSTDGQTGKAAFEAGFGVMNGVVGDIGTSITAATLGGQYDGALANTLGGAFQHTGLALAAVQTCYDFAYNFDDDDAKKATLVNLVKNIANNAVGYFGSSALQVGFAGVYVFDILLSTVQSDMLELKLENIGEVYQYYNDVESTRSNKEWRSMFIQILKDNKDDPGKAQELINQEIDNFCGRFWKLGYGKQKEIAGIAGKKVMFDQNEDDIKALTAEYKAYLMNKLQAPLTSARNYLLNQAMEASQKEFEIELLKLQRELNKKVTVQIIENPDEEGEYLYSGYTVRFAPLSGNANPKTWSGTMPQSGTLTIAHTILGHMQCGSPNKLELYKPGEDSPMLSVPYKVSYPTTIIYLNSTGEAKKDEKLETKDEEIMEIDATSDEEYAWVLIETKVEDNLEGLATQNENQKDVYETELLDASPGSIIAKWKYLGDTDTYYDPDVIHGEGATAQTLFGTPPSTIKGEETVTFTITASVTENNLSFYDSSANGRADLCYLDQNGKFTGEYVKFADSNGKNFIEANTYFDKNSDEATVSTVMPSGREEGDKILIEQSGGGAWNVKIKFIYEWKSQ